MSKADRRTRVSSNPWGEPGHERHCTRDKQCKETAVDDQSTERLKVGYVHFLALLEITFACSRLRERVRLFVACALASEGQQQSQRPECQWGSCRKDKPIVGNKERDIQTFYM